KGAAACETHHDTKQSNFMGLERLQHNVEVATLRASLIPIVLLGGKLLALAPEFGDAQKAGQLAVVDFVQLLRQRIFDSHAGLRSACEHLVTLLTNRFIRRHVPSVELR